MTPEKQDKTLELNKHWSADSTPARNEVIMKTTYQSYQRLSQLSNSNQTQNKRRYVNFENGSHFICNLNLNNPKSTIFISFKMTNIASGNQEFVNSLISNTIERLNAKFITFYRTYSGLGLLISKAQVGSYVSVTNDGSSSIKPDLKFPSSKSNCTDLDKWHVISVTWSNQRRKPE